MSLVSGARTTIGSAILATFVVALSASPAAAGSGPEFKVETGSDVGPETFELIISVDVSKGAAPEFDVIETDIDGLVEILESTDSDDRVELHGEAELTWQPSEPVHDLQWGPQQESIEAAWDVTTGSADVVIAVLDSGVNPGPEFNGRLLDGISMIDSDPHVDTFGHGTAVALVAAAAHDGVGVAGVCPSCSVLPVQVATTEGTVPWGPAADGIVWAVDNGADIINLSFGASTAPTIINQSIAYALANDVVVVASASNYGTDTAFYPAATEGVIAVGAHNQQMERYDWSSFGPWVDVSAPGCGADIHGPGAMGCGTSFAAPWISGVVGLLAAEQPDLTPVATEASLENATRPMSWVETGWVAAGELFGRRFTDVARDSYYAQPVAWLVANNITTGITPTTYQPDAPVTRAQLATFLWRYAGEASTASAPGFTDVAPDSYYAQPVAWLVANNITTGITPTTYQPDAPVTRAQLATFLWRYAGEASTASAPGFTDVAPDSYYAQPVAWLVANNITTGITPTTYQPDAPVTRAQLATFLWRYAAND